MKARILLMAALVLVVIEGVAPASAGDAVVPFKASFKAHPRILGVENNFCLI